MRIDKFLKVSRLVKRRTIAKELCDNGLIKVNEKVVKGSYEVRVDDRVEVLFGRRKTIVQVKDIIDVVKKEDVYLLYDLIGVERVDE